MKKLMRLYSHLNATIIVAYVGVILMAVGYVIVNKNMNLIYTMDNGSTLSFGRIIYTIGQMIITNLPVILMINLVCKKENSTFPIILAFVGYFVFIISTFLVYDKTLASYFYSNDTNLFFSTFIEGYMPYQLGFISSILVGYLTRLSFILSRSRKKMSYSYILNDNVLGFILVIVFCFIAGIITSLIFPIIAKEITKIFEYISAHPSDNLAQSFYPVLQKIANIMGVSSIVSEPFLNTTLGGSYINQLDGYLVAGDINLWSYANANNVQILSAGRYLSYNYIINMFVVPSIYLVFFTFITEKKEKIRLGLYFLVASIISIVAGNTLPFEIMLAITCPLLFVVYLLISMFVMFLTNNFLWLYGLELIGTNFNALITSSLPDIVFGFKTSYANTVLSLITSGSLLALLTYILGFIYFRYLSAGIVDVASLRKTNKQIIEALGGTSNIAKVETGFLKLYVYYQNQSFVDIDKLLEIKIYKKKQALDYICLEVGSCNYKMYRHLKKIIHDSENKLNAE